MIQFGNFPAKGILGAIRDFSERNELVLDFPEAGTLRLRIQPKAVKAIAPQPPKPESNKGDQKG